MTDEDKLKDKSRQSSAPPDENPPAARKDKARKGGIAADPGDPIVNHQTDEPYGAKSGRHPNKMGSPRALTGKD